MNRFWIVCLAALPVCVAPVLASAEEGAPAKTDPGKDKLTQLEDITASGTLMKEGSMYVLRGSEAGDVKIMRPKPAKPDKPGEETPAEPALDLNAYVGKAVTVIGKGKIRSLNGKKKITVYTVTHIEVAGQAAPAADAPAAGSETTPAPAVEAPAPAAPTPAVEAPAADAPAPAAEAPAGE